MDVGERIKFRRKQLGLSAEQVAAQLKVSPATVYRYESNEIMNMRIDKLEPIATVLHTTPAYLMGWDEATDSSAGESAASIRYLGEVAAGFNHLAHEQYEYMNVPESWLNGRPASDYFAMRVSGSSMYPAYCDGDEVLCLSCNDMGMSGRIGVILYGDGESTLKRIEYVKGENWVDLVPINPEYERKRIEGEALEQCRVIGRAVRLIRTIDL